MAKVELTFRSELTVAPERAWDWITSVKGISTELRPILKMSVPRGVQSIGDLDFVPGKPMFRSWMFLFGVLPVDYSDMTLLELDAGKGFVEQSSMASMKLWRHERRVIPNGSGCIVLDRLTFEPRRMARFTVWMTRKSRIGIVSCVAIWLERRTRFSGWKS